MKIWDETIYNLTFYKSCYMDNGRIYIGAMCEEGPYGNVTVNLSHVPDEKIPGANYGFLDTNNMNSAIFVEMEKRGWIKKTGVLAPSGYCMYPLVKFTDKFLKMLDD